MQVSIYYVIDTKNIENIYVGSTKHPLSYRLSEHFGRRFSKKKATALSYYMKDRDICDFEIHLITQCPEHLRLVTEQQYIEDLGTLNVYSAIKIKES
jgi:hypothetical protein